MTNFRWPGFTDDRLLPGQCCQDTIHCRIEDRVKSISRGFNHLASVRLDRFLNEEIMPGRYIMHAFRMTFPKRGTVFKVSK